MSLFSGTPITAQTSSQSTTQTPQWLRDAIYNQVQTVQNVAALPFQQYTGQLVAGPTQNQQQAWNLAGQSAGSWQPTVNAATQGLQQLSQEALSGNSGGLAAASPYMNAASQGAAGGIANYMNPYNNLVTDQIARLGARNLTENLLPGISDQFVQAGQFGGSRMGEFGSRALRDTQEAILGEQARALQSGYGQALGASQGDINTQLQLGQLAGNLGGTDLTQRSNVFGNLLQAAQQGQQLQQNDMTALAQAGEQQRAIQQGGLDAAYQQYLRAQQYPQQQTSYLTQQLQALNPMVPSVNVQSSVAPTGMSPSVASQLAGGLSGIAGLLNG